MECQVVFRCQCNNKTYPSKQALAQHQKTQTHTSWRERNELKQLRIVEGTYRNNKHYRGINEPDCFIERIEQQPYK